MLKTEAFCDWCSNVLTPPIKISIMGDEFGVYIDGNLVIEQRLDFCNSECAAMWFSKEVPK